MNNYDIVKAAEEKARRNGWEGSFHRQMFTLLNDPESWADQEEFSRFFWKDEPLHEFSDIVGDAPIEPIEGWKYHLARISSERDPLGYIEKFL